MLPVAFKNQLASVSDKGFVLKRAVFQPCLELYPMSEWNKMMVKLVGENVTIILNGKTVVDHAKLFNYFDKKGSLPKEGPIQLQTHGAPMQWRNLFIKEL